MLSRLGLLDPILNLFPLWLVAILIIAACLLAREAGSYLYRQMAARRTKDAEDESSDAESHIIAAIFGLLAFIVGLTFSIALDRYDARRGWVAEEANAISTTYLRASLFDEPHKSQLQSTLRQYAHSRIAPEGLWNDRMEAQLQHSLALRKRLWDETHAAVYPVRETELASYFVDAMNETLNVGTRRQLAGRAHVPTRILDVLLVYLLVASAVLGYLLRGRKGGRRQASTVLLILFTIMIVVILDLDRPQAGTIKVPQRALEELVATLDQDAARKASAVPPPEQR